MDSKEKNLFNSMSRWHINAHVSDEEWLECFEAVKHTLDVKEKMDPIDEEFQSFLETKFHPKILKNQFSIAAHLRSLESHVKQYYDEKLNKRLEENEDEFDVENIFQGVKSEDGMFYLRVFLPAAIFRSYSIKHPNVKRITLMHEAFTLGAGSRTEDLSPELTALCSFCSGSDPDFTSYSVEDIECVNKQVFLLQLQDRFHLQSRHSSSESSVNTNDFKNEGFELFNPFDASSSDSDEVEATSYPCTICTKSFSKHEYLKFHMECFHSKKTSLSVKYAAEADELITSFDVGSKSDSSKQVTQTAEPMRIRFAEPEELMVSFNDHETLHGMSLPGKSLRSRTVDIKDSSISNKRRITRSLKF